MSLSVDAQLDGILRCENVGSASATEWLHASSFSFSFSSEATGEISA